MYANPHGPAVRSIDAFTSRRTSPLAPLSRFPCLNFMSSCPRMAPEHANDDKRYSSRNDLVTDLYEAIQAIEGDGSFAAQGDLGEVNPGLEIEGLGLIGLPISSHDVDRLCEAGVSGQGGRHYVDSRKIKFRHPRWSERENVAIRTMCEQLGVPGGATHVTARFSCITIETAGTVPEICEPTESERFGTLQICLPSLHAGGDITVQANDTTITQNTDTTCWWNCSYQAQLSDTFQTVRTKVFNRQSSDISADQSHLFRPTYHPLLRPDMH